MNLLLAIKRGKSSGIVRETFWFTLSNIFFQGSKFFTYLWVAKILGPETYGLWNGLLLIVSYGMNSHAGVLNAMNREIPYCQGTGDTEKIEEIRNISFGVIGGVTPFLGALVFLSSFLGNISSDTVMGLRFLSFILICQQLYVFYQFILKSHCLFILMSVQQTFFSILTLLIILPLTYYFRFKGFLIGQILVLSVILLFLFYKVPIKCKPAFNWKKTVHLAIIGFPIMLAGLVYGLMTTVDRIMILKFLGKDQLGYYSLSIMATGILMLIPMTVGQVIYPKMTKKYGETGQVRALRALVYRPVFYLVWIMIPILLMAYWFLPPMIIRFLPEYIEGIPALKITVFGVFFLSITRAFANFFNTVGLQRIYLLIQISAVLLVVFFNWLSLNMGFGIEGIAVATSVTYIIYTVLLIAVTHYQLYKEES